MAAPTGDPRAAPVNRSQPKGWPSQRAGTIFRHGLGVAGAGLVVESREGDGSGMAAAVEADVDIATARPARPAIALSVAAALLAIPQAFLIGDIVAVVVIGPQAGLTGLGFAALAAGLALVGALRILGDAVATGMAAADAVAFKRRLRRRWFSVAAAWSPVAGDRPSTGEVASTLVDRVETLDPWFVRYALARARMTVVPVAVVLAVAPVSWVVALLLLAAGPLIPVLMSLIGAKARDLGRKQIDETAGLTGLLMDRVRGLATIRALGASERVAADLAETGERLRGRTMQVLAVAFLSSAVLEFFASVGIALAAIFVGFHLMGWFEVGGDFGLAGGVAMLVLAPEFFQPLRDFAGAYHDRATALSLSDRAAETFRAGRPAMPVSAARRDGGAMAPVAVRVEDVAVEAPDSGRRLLEGVTLDIRPGEHVALTGASGAGKSLLLYAVAGLVAPASGRILLDGRAPGEKSPPTGWIGQEPFVLHGSVLANLASDPEAPPDRAAAGAVLDAVGLAPVVARMPRGLLTPLGETGAGLSRGELRRVTIARALSSGAGLLLADEPTADLDEVTAREVADALLAAAAGRTLLLATHDAALARRMDREFRVEAGRIREVRR